MKKTNSILNFLFTVAVFATVTATTFAQNKAAYMIPDIGAPGTNVYIELLAHTDSIGAFGNNSFVNGNSLVLRPTNSADNWKVQFSPLTVSWNGRLITAHAFIHPDLAPTSWRWNEGINIPIGLYGNGNPNPIRTFNFYVVQPFKMPDLTQTNETVFGQGSLGIRSPRGAMIVDNLILDCKTYTVSTNDCDPNTEGNQGYLPCVLTVLGNIKGCKEGTNITSIISVDGNNQDAGAGGGGGGGAFTDYPLGIDRNHWRLRGGHGFTGGGLGGINGDAPLGGGNRWTTQEGGHGSGSNAQNYTDGFAGNSLNGVRGALIQGYESAGGGTGHPFGQSGQGSWANDRVGGYGGGSGGIQQAPGGVGAYFTVGSRTDNRDGKAHGNSVVIPLAGGSGGASGNPQFPGTFSGYGGGAGGAMAINARNISSVLLHSRGADGGESTGDRIWFGGSGSGGGIVATSKTNSEVGFNVNGGTRRDITAGSGVYRNDAFNSNNLLGLVTDTTNLIERNTRIRGNTANTAELYIKSLNSAWHKINSEGTFAGNWNFEFDYDELENLIPDYNGEDTVFYFFAVQKNPTFNNENRTAVPEYILSQAAANILILRLPIPETQPIIELVENYTVDTIFMCSTDVIVKIDLQKIWNAGNADLVFDKQPETSTLLPWFPNVTIEPTEKVGSGDGLRWILKPGDTATVSIEYIIPASVTSRTYHDTIKIFHNDSLRPNPWLVDFEIPVQKYNLRFEPEIIDLGEHFVGATVSETTIFSLVNIYDIALNFEFPNINSEYFTYIFSPQNGQVGPYETLEITLTYTQKPTATDGTVNDIFTLKADCENVENVLITAVLVEDPGEIDIRDSVNIGTVSRCGKFLLTKVFTNGIEYTLTIDTITLQSDETNLFDFSTDFIYGSSLNTGEQIDTIFIKANDNCIFPETGIKTAFLDIHTTNQVGHKVIYRSKITLTVIEKSLIAVPEYLEFSNVQTGISQTDTVRIEYTATRNPASFPKIDTAFFVLGEIFEITNYSTLTNKIFQGKNDFVNASIRCFATEAGSFYDELVVILKTECDNEGCPDTLIIPVFATVIQSPFEVVEMPTVNLEAITFCDTVDILIPFPSENIDSVGTISGANFDLFEYEILELSSRLRIIAKSELSTSIGLKTATLDVFASSGGFDTVYKYTFTVEVVAGIVVAPTVEINFGEVEVGTTSENETVILINQGSKDIKIKSATLQFGENFVMGWMINGFTIFANSTVPAVVVAASPTVEGTLFDTLIIVVQYPTCEEIWRVPLRVEGLEPEFIPIEIIASKHDLVDPTSMNYAIPIYIKSAEDIDEVEISDLTILFDRTVFAPREVRFPGTSYYPLTPIIQGEFVAVNPAGTMIVRNLKANDTTLLLTIRGIVLLGDKDSSLITFGDFYDENITVKFVEGYIKLDICREGNDRLLTLYSDAPAITVKENIVSNNLEVECKVVEVGDYSLEIVNLFGQATTVRNWTVSANSELTFNFEIDVLNFAIGVYMVVMNTPTAKYAVRFMISR